jgi:RNA polymerase sigma factor (sigma-70 family)
VHGDPASQAWVLARLSRLPAFLARLNRRHGAPLSGHELADVLQEIYVHLWPKLTAIPNHCDVEAWALAFARRQYRAALRRRFERPQVMGDSDLAVPARPAPDPARREAVADVVAALQALDPEDVSFVSKRLLEGLSFATIAREAQLSISMVKSRFYRSVSRLRGRMELRRALGAAD